MSESPVAAVRQPSTDQVLESVADETRRDVLAVLREEPEAVSVRDLATAVAALRTGRSYAEVTDADRKPIAVALVHVHLPGLSAAGLVDWEPGERVELAADRDARDEDRARDRHSGGRECGSVGQPGSSTSPRGPRREGAED